MKTKWILIQSIQSIDWRIQTYPTEQYFALERKRQVEEDKKIQAMIWRAKKTVLQKYEKKEKTWMYYGCFGSLKFISYDDPNYSNFDDEMSNLGCDMARESI